MTRVVMVLDCADPERLANFWGEALHYRYGGFVEPYAVLHPPEGSGQPELLLQRVPEPKAGKNRMHLDVRVDDIEAEVVRLEGLGARRLAGETEEYGFRWVVLADPEGNELCVCDAGAGPAG